jgi:hypothetical protein
VLARRVATPLHAALVGEAALALEEELLPLAAALLALGTGISSHKEGVSQLGGEGEGKIRRGKGCIAGR